jgi:hypothetical protein
MALSTTTCHKSWQLCNVTFNVMVTYLANTACFRPLRARPVPNRPAFRAPGARIGRPGLTATLQAMQSLQVESQTYQAPLTRHSCQATQRELPEPQRFFDDANHRFNRGLTQPIDGLANLGLKLAQWVLAHRPF